MIPSRRPAATEFWLLAGLSVLAISGLVLVLWAPWEKPSITADRKLVFYCAAGMARPVQAIVEEYERQYGVRVQVNFGGSGTLLSTIRSGGGRGDLFLSADQFHMDRARQEGLVAETLPVAYLQPVLIVTKSTQENLKQQGKPVTGLTDLLRPDLKVVLANPDMAAIGKMVKEALSDSKIGIWPKLGKELQQGNNRVSTVGTVNEVVTAVRTGENKIGIVWRPLARQTEGLVMIEPPEFADLREVLQVGILTGAEGEQATAALQFARYLAARDRGLTHFAKHHFDVVPDADVWEERPKILLAAGAMLRPGIEEVVQAFQKREGVTIDTSYHGCGVLVSQMKGVKSGEKAGKFPDAYFACDVTFMDMVQQWFDAAVLVSANDMVIIVKKGNPRKISRLEDLAGEGLKVGLAHPEKSALGKLTDDLLKKIDPNQKIFTPDWHEKQVVHSEAGHDLVNKLRVGALDAAVVYRSNAMSNPENLQKFLDIVEIDIPEALARQPFAVARDSPHKYLMKRLLNAIVARQTADHFKTIGFRWVYGGQ